VTDRLKQIEALAQRGMSDRQIMLSMGIDAFSMKEIDAIERGRAAGIALINSKLFDQALAGDPRAIDSLNKKFEAAKGKQVKYIDEQLEILRRLK
jgi:hypothetical protein